MKKKITIKKDDLKWEGELKVKSTGILIEVLRCEICNCSLVDSSVGMCDCGAYKW